jgi:hypothetical protein
VQERFQKCPTKETANDRHHGRTVVQVEIGELASNVYAVHDQHAPPRRLRQNLKQRVLEEDYIPDWIYQYLGLV